MTKETCYTAIRDAITAHGFEASTRWDSDQPCIEETNTAYFGLTIEEPSEVFPFVGGCEIRITFQFQGRIRQMGGNPSPDELLTASDEIRCGAELVKALQNLELTYTERHDAKA